jgi:hypothetical protein
MKTEALSVRVSPAMKKAVEKAAKDDRRSTASMVEKISVDRRLAPACACGRYGAYKNAMMDAFFNEFHHIWALYLEEVPVCCVQTSSLRSDVSS